MANVRKKISELTALTSASLDTTILGVDGGTTYKIELDTLADAVTARVNILDRSRLTALETYTSSFSASFAGGTISSSAQITSLGFVSSSTDISLLNSFTASQDSINTAFTNGINGRLTTSSFQAFSSSVHSEILAATDEQSFNGLISSSQQITTLGFITSSQTINTGSLATTGSNTFRGNQTINGLVQASASLSAGYHTFEGAARFIGGQLSFENSNTVVYGALDFRNISDDAGLTLQNIGVSGSNKLVLAVQELEIFGNTALSGSFNLNGYPLVSANQTGSFLTNLNGTISGSSQLTSSYDIRYAPSASYLTSLDGAISSSSQILNGSGIYSSSAQLPNGLISGSSQLTSSFDTRYTLSGSVQLLPSNLVSSSAQITTLGFISSSDSTTALNSYTASLKNAIELTGSTVSFLGNIIVYGTQSVINSTNVELSDNILYLSPTASTDNDLGIVGHYNDGTYRHAGIFMDASDGHSWKVFNGLQTETTATVDTSGTGFTLADFKAGVITGTSFNGTINSTNGVISGSSQLSGKTIPNLSGSFTGSFKGNLAGVADYASTIATVTTNTTTDTTLYPMFSLNAAPNSYITPTTHPSGSFYYNGVTRKVYGETFVGAIEATNGVISGSSQLTSSFDIRYAPSASYLTSLNGAISSSSQLTSSFDTIYTLSGSVGATPSGTISGSSQLTSSFDTRYLTIDGDNVISSSTQLTSSFELKGSGIYSSSVQLPSGLISGSSQLPLGLVSGSSQLTASLDTRYAASGSGGSIPAGTISGSSQITGIVNLTNLSATSQISASVFVGGFGVSEAKHTVISSKPMTFWPNITFESVRFTTAGGVIIGKNGETNDFGNKLDVSGSVRFIGNTTITGSVIGTLGITGSIAATNGVISGSSQLTSSLDARYLVTGSVTSSINQLNIFTASAATTGSNSFNGNQTITGSLNVSSVAVISSSFTANSSSLTLNSGSNFYLQNNGIAQITGSLLVSGSTTFTGSISISSGSIIMPNRPAFRITGAGGPTYATTVISGSMAVVDYNEGGHYNVTNGTFTAPIAGLYQVNLVCRTYSNSGAASQAVVVKNNTAGSNGTVQIMLEWAANTTVNHMGGSTISKLAVGDTLKAMIFMGTSSFDGNDNFSVAYIG